MRRIAVRLGNTGNGRVRVVARLQKVLALEVKCRRRIDRRPRSANLALGEELTRRESGLRIRGLRRRCTALDGLRRLGIAADGVRLARLGTRIRERTLDAQRLAKFLHTLTDGTLDGRVIIQEIRNQNNSSENKTKLHCLRGFHSDVYVHPKTKKYEKDGVGGVFLLPRIAVCIRGSDFETDSSKDFWLVIPLPSRHCHLLGPSVSLHPCHPGCCHSFHSSEGIRVPPSSDD